VASLGELRTISSGRILKDSKQQLINAKLVAEVCYLSDSQVK